MEGNGNHLYTMDKILAFIIFSQNDRWHNIIHLILLKRENIIKFYKSDFFLRIIQECWLKNIDFCEKFFAYWWLWCLRRLIWRPQPNKICLTLTLPSNLSPVPDSETYQLHNCEQSKGTCLQGIFKQPG